MMAKNVLESFSHLPDSHVVTLTLGELRGKVMTQVTEQPDATMGKVFKPRRVTTVEPTQKTRKPAKRTTKKKARRK